MSWFYLSVVSCQSSLENIQSNLNSSNTDGSFTMANSNSFLSPYENLRLAQENKNLGKFLFYHEIVCCVYSLESPYRGDSNEYTQHAIDVKEIKQKSLNYRYLLPDTMINPQWLELPKSRTIFYGPKDVRAIEVRLYVLYVYRF